MIESGSLPRNFYVGDANCAGRPDFLVHEYNPNFFILRQSACTNFEKPLLYLLFGSERALLLDTGAGKVDVAGAVDSIVREWLQRNRRDAIPLVVAHSHGHSDHVAGDAQFGKRTNATLVARDTESVQKFFGIGHWPEEIVEYDLGNRVLDIIPIPGHQPASIAVYDR